MSFKNLSTAAIAVVALSAPAFAESVISVSDPFARVSTKMAKSGAAFMVISNTGDEADQLVSVSSDVAKKVELHTHEDDGNGVMKMMHVKDGFTIPAGGKHELARGADHVMFMGLTRSLAHGDEVTLTLSFEKAGDVILNVPVDLERKAGHEMRHKHGKMKVEN